MSKYTFFVWKELFFRFLAKGYPFGKSFRKDIYYQIGRFFFNESGLNREISYERLKRVYITDIYYKNGYLYIVSLHPGLLIGKKGVDAEKLNEWMKECWAYHFPLRGIRFVQNRELNRLFDSF